jgi:predicted nucleic acid-binding Zn ribbon protein
MPIYTFQNPETGKTIDIRQRMTDKHEYTDENGLNWTRVFEVVNVGFDTSPNIFSSTSFADSTSNKKETIGDIQSRAVEASEKRKDKLGYDPVQKKWFDKYAKERNGKKHPNDPSA